MVDRQEFDRLVKDALNNLYDYAALEIHPLTAWLPDGLLGRGQSRAGRMRHFLVDAIEKLKPPEVAEGAASLAWRPYRILYGRYVECLDLQHLQDDLGLSARQLRREHARSLEAFTALVWEQIQAEKDAAEPEGPQDRRRDDEPTRDYRITRERLDLVQILEGVMEILQNRIQSAETSFTMNVVCDELPHIWADRIILRQILLSFINQALHCGPGSDVSLDVIPTGGWVELRVQCQTEAACLSGEDATSLDTARHWAQRLGAKLDVHPADAEVGTQLVLSLPIYKMTVMVVDDQDAAIRMFTRYLSRRDIQVVGVRDPEAVLSTARKLQPQCITLDLMMPSVDGWEVLQSLRNDPDTQEIPVVVCSVWNEPELAASLGASDFLRKPVMQKHLLAALSRLGLLDTPDGSRPSGP